MADHAIVLYDPTIDDKPEPLTEEELNAEEERKREEEARGPHKSLKAILGIQDKKKKVDVKVPVVIDPKLSKVLRPHQIEGVKVGKDPGCRANPPVSVPLHHWSARSQGLGLYHG